MKLKFLITLLVVISILFLTPSIALAWDEGVTVASDWEQIWKDDANVFASIISEYPGWNNTLWAHDPFATWWQEESNGGIDNQKADYTELSLILSHSAGGGAIEVGFGLGKPSTGPDPVRLGYDSPDNYGYSIWWFIIECEVLNDTDVWGWADSMTGTHMLLGFKNELVIVAGYLEQLANRLTGNGVPQEKIQDAFFHTFVNTDEPRDDNIARILAQNADVADNDWIDTFDTNTPVDPADRIYITFWSYDTTSPAAVTNLSVDTPTQNSITIHWTSPGDDGNSGTASQYDIRYSTSAITAGNFASATQVTGEPTPLVAGSAQSFTVTGLNPSTTYYFALKTADGIPNWSAVSNSPSGTTSAPPDTTAPAAVTNLATSSPTQSSITLSWTAPGDDGSTGTASQYDIRYSTATITAGNFASATQATGEPTPLVAGSAQSFTVSGLNPSTTYYFALKTADEVPNWSAVSNSPSGTTSVPLDTTAPAAVTNLATSSPTQSSITLSWTSPGDDGSTGTASQYDIRYSTATITAGNFASATQATGEPTPLVAGSAQSFTVSGLNPSTTYYFAIKTADEVPNWSTISNSPSGTTTATGGWLTGWENRIQITIDHTKIDSTLTQFPVLVHLSSSSGQSSQDVTQVFDEVGANSLKIAATTSDGQTQLYIEVEKWDSVNEEAWLWVSKAGWQISSTEDTILYLYYDNAQPDNTTYVGIPGSTTARNVWDSSFRQVLHMSSNLQDSTVNNNYGTLKYGNTETTDTGTTTSMIKETSTYRLCYLNDYYNGWTCEITSGPAQGQKRTVTDYVVTSTLNDKSIYLDSPITGLASGQSYWLYKSGALPSYVNGEVGGAVEFNGIDQWISATTLTASELSGNNLTLEVIAKPDVLAGSQYLLCMNGPFYFLLGNDKLKFGIYAGSATWLTGNTPLGTQPMYLTGVYNGVNMTTFVDGILDNQTAKTGNLSGSGENVIAISNNMYLNGDPRFNFDGEIDEVRITKGVRSVAWIKATYYTSFDDLLSFDVP